MIKELNNTMNDYLFNKNLEQLRNTKELYNTLNTLYRFTIGNPSRNCLSKEFKEYCESVSFEQFLKDFEIVRKQVIEELERLEEE